MTGKQRWKNHYLDSLTKEELAREWKFYRFWCDFWSVSTVVVVLVVLYLLIIYGLNYC